MGAVNVQPPRRRWGGTKAAWQVDKLAGYLTKYIGKEFDETEKSAKKYWHTKNIDQPEIIRYWLRAESYYDAIVEAHDAIHQSGATSLSIWNDHAAGVVCITSSTSRERIGKHTMLLQYLDLL